MHAGVAGGSDPRVCLDANLTLKHSTETSGPQCSIKVGPRARLALFDLTENSTCGQRGPRQKRSCQRLKVSVTQVRNEQMTPSP